MDNNQLSQRISALGESSLSSKSPKVEASSDNTKNVVQWIIIAILLAIIVSGITFIIFSLINKTQPSAQTEEERFYNEYSIEYSFDDNDDGFLGTSRKNPQKYIVINNYLDYLEKSDGIDKWGEDRITTGSNKIKQRIDASVAEGGSFVDPEKYKLELIERYTEGVKEEVDEIKKGFSQGMYSKNYFDNNSLILVEYSVYNEILNNMRLKHITTDNNNLNIIFSESSSGDVANADAKLFFITVPKQYLDSSTKINIKVESKQTSKHPEVLEKPIIYLYPTSETDVSVKLSKNEKITHSYPHYSDGWNVTASPNGNLIDKSTRKNLYSLYYESENSITFKIKKDGFVVKGTDAAKFLEEKLAILGLNAREAEEFIIYWLPQLESNKYNYIRFATTEEISENMPLEINPKPDTIIRILMTFKALDGPIKTQEQVLSTPHRSGFVVVEWGGAKI